MKLVQQFNEQPREDLYEDSKCHDIKEGQDEAYLKTKTEITEDGIVSFFHDIPHPKKGFPTTQTTESINIVKKLTLLTFSGIPTKRRIKKYLDLCDYILDNPFKRYIKKGKSDYHKIKTYNKFSREFLKFLTALFTILKIDLRLARIISEMVEKDDAYRYRLQDIFSESSKEVLIKEPAKEIKRLIKIYLDRENPDTASKVKKLLYASYLLYIPKYRRAFSNALSQIDYERFKLDNSDKFWCLPQFSYRFMGLNEQQRTLRHFANLLGRQPITVKIV